MTNKALCVGINRYPVRGADLKGCVNDAHGWAKLLTEHFDFPAAEVKVLTDSQATKAAIMRGLEDLLAGSSRGDLLVFTNSSHGSYIPDTSGDEETYDETLCPYDVKENAITDDELRELFSGLPAGVRLTVISDSCHSGTVTRALLADNMPGLRFPDDRRVRFLNPALVRGGPVLPDPMAARPRKRMAFRQSDMNHILLSGARDNEYAFDADIGGTYHGAMTAHALKAIRQARYRITYAELAERLQKMLDKAGYFQHPQLEGRSRDKRRQVFT